MSEMEKKTTDTKKKTGQNLSKLKEKLTSHDLPCVVFTEFIPEGQKVNKCFVYHFRVLFCKSVR